MDTCTDLHIALQELPWFCEQMLLLLLLDVYFLIKVNVFPTCLLCSVRFPQWRDALQEAAIFLHWGQSYETRVLAGHCFSGVPRRLQ